jgi:hypothetical protein
MFFMYIYTQQKIVFNIDRYIKLYLTWVSVIQLFQQKYQFHITK